VSEVLGHGEEGLGLDGAGLGVAGGALGNLEGVDIDDDPADVARSVGEGFEGDDFAYPSCVAIVGACEESVFDVGAGIGLAEDRVGPIADVVAVVGMDRCEP